ncbi:MAG TPA: DUF3108 domain-containing protein [Steroidobacteraceae bacterium]|jgi:hypothetical protein|nr:DUF3108 domain-containing protein [Steroidobacteraceae bacterium]
MLRAVAVSTLLGALCGSAHSHAAELSPFEASYAWSWHGATVAVSTLKLENRGRNTWAYTSSTEPRGLGRLYPYRPRLTSLLRVTERGVEPQHFRADAGSKDRDADVEFNWETGRATGTYDGVAVDLPIKDGVQDDLSVQVELIVDLLRGKTPDTLWLIDKNTIRDYHYQREGDETLDTPLGHIATTIYSSQHTGSPRITRFWCAPSLGYLPMRVEQKRIDSVEWTMEIRALTRN